MLRAEANDLCYVGDDLLTTDSFIINRIVQK